MVKKSEIKTIAQCQEFIRSSIETENFCYDISTISFYSSDVKVTILNADFKPTVEKGVKLTDLQLACLNFSQTYNYQVICRDEEKEDYSIAIHLWDADTQKVILSPTIERYQVENSGDLPSQDVIDSYDRPVAQLQTISEVKVEKVKTEKKIEAIEPEIVEDTRPIKLPSNIGVYVCLTDKENKSVKKRLPLMLEDVRSQLTAWLNATDSIHQGQLSRFKDSTINSPHNALVLYFYRPYTWVVMDVAGDRQLRKVEVSSASKAQILSKNKGTIQQSSYTGIPELGSMYTISPIKILESGNTYLAQAYIELTDDEYLLRSRKIALFENGVLRYYSELFETERDLHDIHPLVEADGKRIFPQTSIALIEFQTLEVNELNAEYYIQTKKPHYEPTIGGKLVLKSSVTADTDMIQFVKSGKEYLERNTYVNSPIRFEGIKHPNISPKPPKKHEITHRQTPKPIKIHNEKVVSGSVEFTDIIGTVPMMLRLTPSETGYSLVGLPIKLPSEFTYDCARYITSNLGMGALGYLNSEVARIQGGDNLVGRHTKQDMIEALSALITGIKSGLKLDPTNILISKNKLRAYMSQQNFTASTVDPYYSFNTLGTVSIVTEIEGSKYSYRLTNFGDSNALYRNNLMSVQTWIQRVSYNLKNYFGIKKPSFDEIKTYLKEHFKFQNCDLKVYWDKGIYFEVWHDKKMVAKQLVEIVNPENYQNEDPEKLSRFSDQRRAVLLGRTPTWTNNRIFEKVLKCNNLVDSDIISYAKSQLHKVVDKFISSNQKQLVGKNRVVQITSISSIVGFDKADSNGFSNIKTTFLKFIVPFSIESKVGKGEIFNLRTGEILNQHSASELFEVMVKNWKVWNQDKNQIIALGGYDFKKPNPGKLMMEVHHKVSDNPHLDQIVWAEFLDVWWQLTREPIGFRTATGVVLTPWSMLPNRADVWEYRLKMQLIDILRENKNGEGKVSRIESHLQLSEDRLKEILTATYPIWESQISDDVKKHLASLQNSLDLSRKSANI